MGHKYGGVYVSSYSEIPVHTYNTEPKWFIAIHLGVVQVILVKQHPPYLVWIEVSDI